MAAVEWINSGFDWRVAAPPCTLSLPNATCPYQCIDRHQNLVIGISLNFADVKPDGVLCSEGTPYPTEITSYIVNSFTTRHYACSRKLSAPPHDMLALADHKGYTITSGRHVISNLCLLGDPLLTPFMDGHGTRFLQHEQQHICRCRVPSFCG